MPKLNLMWDNDSGLIYGDGFINISPFINQETDNIKRGNVKDINRFADNGECEEIIALDVIDYLDIKDVVNTINHWISKLAHGGHIIIGGIDCYEVARNFTRYNITLMQANEAIHGKYSEKPYLLKRTQFTLKGLCELLVQSGLKIVKKRLDQTTMRMEVEAIRP